MNQMFFWKKLPEDQEMRGRPLSYHFRFKSYDDFQYLSEFWCQQKNADISKNVTNKVNQILLFEKSSPWVKKWGVNHFHTISDSKVMTISNICRIFDDVSKKMLISAKM